jgi:hypothetical protein
MYSMSLGSVKRDCWERLEVRGLYYLVGSEDFHLLAGRILLDLCTLLDV